MKNKLCYLVDIVENNKDCVILKVKDEKKLDLIKLGYFSGDEELIRLTKGKDHTCTVFNKDGSNFNWHWGTSGYTLVSDNLSKKGKLIEECITEDFDIYIGDNKEKIKDTMNIMSLEDSKKAEHYIKMMYWKNDDNVSVHKDGVFYKFFDNINLAIKHFRTLNYDVDYRKEYIAQAGCIVKEYYITKDKELTDWKEETYFDLITNLDDINDSDSFTVARVCNGVNSVELHYNDGLATIEYGTRIADDEWKSEVEGASWFDKNMNEKDLQNKLWDLFEENYDKEDDYAL